MLIYNWTAEFCSDICELEKVCFKHPWSAEMIEQTSSGDNFLGVVAVEDGKTVGYAGAIFAADVADIALVAVSPEFTRRGIAFALVNRLCERLAERNVENVYLEARYGNEPAIGLYKKCGFSAVGIRKKYYEDTEDAIVMFKSIKN